ncbi:MAG TPA: CheB methylesterase domain-containing protein [Lacipirellulaceae bacterium]|nr:CheB methylesterase domain-containing protein [Lacipirellulaceae bacterium]
MTAPLCPPDSPPPIDRAYSAGELRTVGVPLSCRLPGARPELIAIGVSTGGPAALAALLPQLPASLGAPVVVVQHMPAVFTKSLADDLNRVTPLCVREARHREPLEAGVVYLAPGGRQMKIAVVHGRAGIRITDDAAERGCRPSVDYLFRSAADCYGAAVLALVLTGMGDDGLLGCRLLKQHGAHIVAQDEASCVVYGMPRQVVNAGLADVVCPLSEMPALILDALARRNAP